MRHLAVLLLRAARLLVDEDEDVPIIDTDQVGPDLPSYVHVRQNLRPILGPPLKDPLTR